MEANTHNFENVIDSLNTNIGIELNEHKSPVINPKMTIGTFGNVSNGKSSTIQSLTGVKTQKFEDELKQGKTIKLGYTNMKMYQCEQCDTVRTSDGKTDNIPCECGKILQSEKMVSFCDAPGHNSYDLWCWNG